MNKNKLKLLIKQLISSDEGFKLDFKLKLSFEYESEKKEFVKDVIAIANTPGGRGYIIFGVEDQTQSIVGLTEIPEHVEERIQQIIANRATPPVPVRFDVVEIEGKEVGLLTIFKSMQVPHQMLQTGAFYVRRGSTTDKATRHEVANMLQQFGMLSFENVPCRSSRLEDLDEQAMAKQLGHFHMDKAKLQVFLSTMGILATDLEKERYYPTYGGLLLFGKNPQAFIPQAILEINTESEVIGIGGNLSTMIRSFQEEAKKLLPKAYPLKGLAEVVTNAILHRNYWNNAQYIQVKMGEDQVVVSNPMSHQMENEKSNTWRANPWLYSRLLMIGEGQGSFHIGIGMEKTKALFASTGEIAIQTKREEGIYEVTLPGMKHYRN